MRGLRAVRDTALAALRGRYAADGAVEVGDLPHIVRVTGACENIDTVFALEGHELLFLSQTGQLLLETELLDEQAVFCVLPSFRADAVDTRHLQEFTLVEEEFRWDSGVGADEAGTDDAAALFGRLTRRLGAVMRTATAAALSEHAELLSARPGGLRPLEIAAECEPALVSYDEALRLAPGARWGDDLPPAAEHALLREHAVDGAEVPVLLTRHPETIKFFNMRADRARPSVVLSADLLLPVAGEAIGAAVREDDPRRLERRLAESSLARALATRGADWRREFRGYLSLVASGRLALHAGYGLGLERFLQYWFGLADIRQVSAPARLSARLAASA